jgi:hypothetical protein
VGNYHGRFGTASLKYCSKPISLSGEGVIRPSRPGGPADTERLDDYSLKTSGWQQLQKVPISECRAEETWNQDNRRTDPCGGDQNRLRCRHRHESLGGRTLLTLY